MLSYILTYSKLAHKKRIFDSSGFSAVEYSGVCVNGTPPQDFSARRCRSHDDDDDYVSSHSHLDAADVTVRAVAKDTSVDPPDTSVVLSN